MTNLLIRASRIGIKTKSEKNIWNQFLLLSLFCSQKAKTNNDFSFRFLFFDVATSSFRTSSKSLAVFTDGWKEDKQP